MIIQIKKRFLYNLSCLFIATLISGCSITTPTSSNTPPPPKKHAIYDSTVYFANRTASVSLRASLLNQPSNIAPGGSPFAKGYKLQFRSTSRTNRSISQASIIVGGKKITLTPEAFFIPINQGVTLTLNLKDTYSIHQYNNATLRFKYNNESVFFTISNNQISEFIP